ncbi:MAG: alpha-ketoglutarate-dependent dioxygenase AlkB [Cellvibrionaceae bacterium]
MTWERIEVEGGELILVRDWLDRDSAEWYFGELRTATDWEQSTIVIAGREVRIPRLNAWYGDRGRAYTYSGKRFEALPWSESLASLRGRTQDTVDGFASAVEFRINSALLNLYRNGADSVGWHSDDEPELGPRPQIASVSLGASRRFVLKHRRDAANKLELILDSGSLLLMLGGIQHRWRHALPKTRRPVGERINITFRQVFASG